MSLPTIPAPKVRIAGWRGEAQLVADADVAAGALLSAEYPIAFVEIRDGEDEIAPWILLEGILSSDAMYSRVAAADLKLTKWPLSSQDQQRLDDLARRYRRNPQKLAQLYHRVAANNIRYAQGGVTGYGIWPLVSRCNHSCDPNVHLAATVRDPLVELLMATRDIRRGEALCWNYYADPAFLQRGWFERNARLHQDFQFLCRCPRCESERPAAVEHLPREALIRYFRGTAA